MEALLQASPVEELDADPLGLIALREHYIPPAIGRVKKTHVDMNGINKDKYVVVLAGGADDYTFTLPGFEGQPLWLGRVSDWDCEIV